MYNDGLKDGFQNVFMSIFSQDTTQVNPEMLSAMKHILIPDDVLKELASVNPRRHGEFHMLSRTSVTKEHIPKHFYLISQEDLLELYQLYTQDHDNIVQRALSLSELLPVAVFLTLTKFRPAEAVEDEKTWHLKCFNVPIPVCTEFDSLEHMDSPFLSFKMMDPSYEETQKCIDYFVMDLYRQQQAGTYFDTLLGELQKEESM